MLDLAGVASGCRVLDVAAGAGDQTLQAAARVGPGGSVLATDISPAILRSPQRRPSARVPRTSPPVPWTAKTSIWPTRSFDVVISRVGLIYFPDQQRALREMRRVLVPGGRVAAIVYATADQNGFFSLPVSIVRRHAKLGPPLPGQPGPFSLGGAGVLAEALSARDSMMSKQRPSPPRFA